MEIFLNIFVPTGVPLCSLGASWATDQHMAPNLQFGELRCICYLLVLKYGYFSRDSARMVIFFVHLFGCSSLGKTIIKIVLQVIAKLTDGKATHIPYRDSKLTRLLQSSLSGHGRISVSGSYTKSVVYFYLASLKAFFVVFMFCFSFVESISTSKCCTACIAKPMLLC